MQKNWRHFTGKDLHCVDLEQIDSNYFANLQPQTMILKPQTLVAEDNQLDTMSEHKFFINRRKGVDRRLDRDPCKNLPMDLYHRKRRKSTERRSQDRSLADDYLAFLATTDLSSQKNH